MKFQNPSLIFFEWTDTRTHGRTHRRTSRNEYAPHFFKVGGIINEHCHVPDTLYTPQGISLWLMSHNNVCLIISRKTYPTLSCGYP